MVKDIASNVRDVRNKQGLKKRDELDVAAIKSEETSALEATEGMVEILQKIAFVGSFDIVEDAPESSVGFISGASAFHIQVEQNIDVEEELQKLKADLKHQEGFVAGVEKKLANERFVSGAPEAVVALERKKLVDGQERILQIKQQIEKLES